MIVQDWSPEAILDHAQEYRRNGWRVIPLHSVNDVGNCTCGKPRCTSQGKHPVEARWQAAEPLSGADIHATFEDGSRNIGIATGNASGFWVLDIDLDKPGTTERMRELQAGRKFPGTRIVKTPGGGYHYYFKMPDFGVTNSASRLPDGIDVRGNGGQVVAPPSMSHKGVYTVMHEGPIADAPDWLLELVRPLPAAAAVDLETIPKITDLPEAEQRRLGAYSDRIVAAELAKLAECREKGWSGPPWNQTTFQVACNLIEVANSPWSPLRLSDAHELITDSAPRDRDFTDVEVEACFASALRKVDGKGRAMPEGRPTTPAGPVYPGDPLTDPAAGQAPPAAPRIVQAVTSRPWTDIGNAQRMVDLYGDELRWIREAEDWAVYEDGCWKPVGKPAARALAQDMILSLYDREAACYDDTPGPNDSPSEREKFYKWTIAQQSSSRVSACLTEVTGQRKIQADMSNFDAEPGLFNVANGVIDLATGELLPHDPSRLMMLQSPVTYDPAAKAPRWQAFLDRCLPDLEVQHFLQKAFGYSLTGSMAEQAMFLHHGSGANGKSVFLVVASHIAGSYSQVVPRETLLAKSASGAEHPTSVARMRGRRFLQASETAAGRRLDEETVKGLTGGEQQTARFMGANFFDFTPTGKIHFVTNHLPRLTDAESIWRRLHLIGWRQTIPKEERDPDLAEKIITEEAEGVLAWAVAGAVAWHKERLSASESMNRDLADYRDDQDTLGEFIAGRLERDGHAFTSGSDVYGAYSAWAFNSGIKRPMTKHDLTRALRERGFEQHRTGRERGFRLRLLGNGMVTTADPLLTR